VAPGLKTLADAFEIRGRIIGAFEQAERCTSPEAAREWLNFVVIGAGPTGVELAGALVEIARHTLPDEFRRIDSRRARVVLIEGSPRVLGTFHPQLSDKARRQLEALGVEVHTGWRVTGIDEHGITYTDDWDAALAENPTLFGQRAAAVASQLGVGIEIDYEQNTDPNLPALQAFIDAYRAVHPYDATGSRPAARLTIDVAAGDRWLIALNRKATADWLRTDTPVLDYANAMVPARPTSADSHVAHWQEHVDGKPQYSPPVPPLAPAKFTGGLYVAYGGRALPECIDYTTSLQKATGPYVQSVTPNGAGTSTGMLGFMFWAAERPSTRGIGTVPPNTCENGMGAGATALNVPVPMPALRQS
jgi:hypothetical protein